MEDCEPAKRFKQLSFLEKAKIVAWNEEGLSSRVIGKRPGRDKATFNQIVQKAKEQGTGDIFLRKPIYGRPKKMIMKYKVVTNINVHLFCVYHSSLK